MDMDSTYPPMLEYIKSLSSEKIIVNRLENIGPRLLWNNKEFISAVNGGGFFLTDGDIDLSETSYEVFHQLVKVSQKYPGFRKVGCALRIDNLPTLLEKSNLIIESEIDNWSKYRFITKNVALAPVDTTIAFYPKYEKKFYHWPAIRLCGEYSVMHKPWYADYDNLNDEELFYIKTAKWAGGFGTSAERGRKAGDTNFSDTLLFKFQLIIKFVLFVSPKVGSEIITKIINSRNSDSKVSNI